MKKKKKAVLGRPRLEKHVVVSIRVPEEMVERLHDIAHLESITSGKTVTMQMLIRDALHFVYTDDERLRECFRRSRKAVTKRYQNSIDYIPEKY